MLSILKSTGTTQEDMIESWLHEYHKVGRIVEELSGIETQRSETVFI